MRIALPFAALAFVIAALVTLPPPPWPDDAIPEVASRDPWLIRVPARPKLRVCLCAPRPRRHPAALKPEPPPIHELSRADRWEIRVRCHGRTIAAAYTLVALILLACWRASGRRLFVPA